MTGTRFAFGENRSHDAGDASQAELGEAPDGLRRLLPEDSDPSGRTFPDIGAASGLHSVAAAQLAFRSARATDDDPRSVATRAARAERFGVQDRVATERDGIPDSRVAGPFDVAYGWGVPHHTGDMWRAIDAAAERVAPGGPFVIAIDRRTPTCGVWTRIEHADGKAPPMGQTATVSAYLACRDVGRPIARLRRGERFADTPGNRGMTRRHDALDWLGGYPDESARPSAIVRHSSPRFELLRTVPADMRQTGIGASGRAEFALPRQS